MTIVWMLAGVSVGIVIGLAIMYVLLRKALAEAVGRGLNL